MTPLWACNRLAWRWLPEVEYDRYHRQHDLRGTCEIPIVPKSLTISGLHRDWGADKRKMQFMQMFVYIFTYWSWCQFLNRSSTWSEAEVQNIEISITHPPSAIQHCRHTTDTRLALAGTKMQKCAACKDFLSRDKSPPGDPVTRDPSGYLCGH